MTRKLKLAVFLTCFVPVTFLPAQNAMESYQRALVQEQAAGNLREAIELYQRAASEAAGDRALAARALIRAAGSYEKLGEPNAAQLYSEVVRKYPEQAAQAALAQQRLAALRRTGPAQVAVDVSSVVGPVLKTYCINCHNQTSSGQGLKTFLGGFTLDTINMERVTEDAEAWENVVRRLRARLEPKTGLQRPDDATYQRVISTLEIALDRGHPLSTPLNTADLASDAELASRLATFLWSGNPDAALLDAATRGRLKDPSVLEQQVRRMLQDPRSENFVNDFFEKWLHLGDLAQLKPDPALFPDFDESLRQALLRETELFLDNQLRQDRSAMELWTANYTFLNERLARHYGVPNVSGTQFRRVALTAGTRAGLLGQGSVLALTSTNNRTSPTMRGKWLLQTFMGVNPPPPPPNIAAFTEKPGTSVRARIEELTGDRRCASCHAIFDPLGFSLENFDGTGRWRNEDGGVPIDASGAFADGARFNGPAEFRAGLLKYRDAFLTHITERMLAYALGRGTERSRVYAYEMPAVRSILREAAPGNYRWSSLIVGIVKSMPFQMKNRVP